MIPIINCSDQHPHLKHPHTIQETSICKGVSECGLYLHPAHKFSKTVYAMCDGISQSRTAFHDSRSK